MIVKRIDAKGLADAYIAPSMAAILTGSARELALIFYMTRA